MPSTSAVFTTSPANTMTRLGYFFISTSTSTAFFKSLSTLFVK